MNEYIAKIYTKIIGNIFSGRFDVHLQVIQKKKSADFKISIFNLTHKVPASTSFEIRKSFKRMPSLVYTKMDQTEYCVSSMFAFGCIVWTLLHVFTCT